MTTAIEVLKARGVVIPEGMTEKEVVELLGVVTTYTPCECGPICKDWTAKGELCRVEVNRRLSEKVSGNPVPIYEPAHIDKIQAALKRHGEVPEDE